ncbi:MAG TPA: methyltransferase domain-containing protein [Rhizomicrobium sp.]|nr:methyltransferase domain-containing protein [Rhizomicrobium sp.]
MKLNLGCGSQILDGWVNVDKFGTPDQILDLETFPWPWADNSADEILLNHVLEHLGQKPEVFIAIMRELYRVCRNGATLHIRVPHPRHDTFLMDPTHVRPIMVATMEMFSRTLNLEWRRIGASNTPLALYNELDFELVSSRSELEEPYRSMYRDGKLGVEELMKLDRTQNNVVVEIEIVLRANKPFRPA